MTALGSEARVDFAPDGRAQVTATVRLGARTHIQCCAYDYMAPILAVDDGPARITVSVPDTKAVTGADAAMARTLAAAVAEFVAEVEKRAALDAGTVGQVPADEPGGQPVIA